MFSDDGKQWAWYNFSIIEYSTSSLPFGIKHLVSLSSWERYTLKLWIQASKLLLAIQHSTLLQTAEQFRFQKFTNSNIFRQTFPSSSLENEIPGQSLGGRWLQCSQLNVAIQRVTRDDGPAVENKGNRGLTLCMNL
jgi:hypothetical protein